MARQTPRHKLTLERLESREVLTAGGPSAQAQYTLEVLNLVRTNPAAGSAWVQDHVDSEVASNLDYYNVDLNQVKAAIAASPARQPLAWNPKLAAAAQAHSDDMARNRFQSHTGSDGSSVEQRLDKAGYTDRIQASENAFAYASSVDNAMEAFLLDWGVADNGHRRNILQPDINDSDSSAEVGIGVARSSNLGSSQLIMTQNFGRQRGAKAQIVGVVFDDRDRDGRYSIGEGKGDVTVEIQNVATGASTRLATWDAGGYQTPVDPGTYRVSARQGDQSLGSRQVTVGKANVKVDFNVSDPPKSAPAPAQPVLAVAPPPPAPAQPQVVLSAVSSAAGTTDEWASTSINWSSRWKAK
jgi:uncharacterized protein YkwD